jgi:hypothetical protein
LILIALVLSACESLGVRAKDDNNAEVEKITPSPGKASMELQAEPVIIFKRSGGFAGTTDQWSIYATGKIVKLDGEEFTVDSAKVAALLEVVQTSGFFDLKAASGIGGVSNCNDCYTYQLTVNGDEKMNTLSFQDGAKDIPQALWDLIKQITDLTVKPTE